MKTVISLHILFLLILSEGKCKYVEEDNVFHLGTKTPYRFIANNDTNIVSHQECQAEKMFGLIRHGTRTPGHRGAQKIVEILSELKAYILDENKFYFGDTCEDVNQLLKNWTFHIEGEKFLTDEGREEMVLLAKRLRKRFPSLLPSKFKNNTFLFRFTKTQRTEESAKNFALGLFGVNGLNDVWYPTPEDPDPILRFYKLCKKWKKEVKKSPLSLKERNKFIRLDEVHKVLADVSERLGLNHTLSFDTVRLMYISCCYETAWSSRRSSPWCFVFTKSDMKVLEYAEELKYYWRDGYGFQINHQQSCPLFQSIVEFFQNKRGEHKAMFYFTHSGTILKALARLGLFKDSFKLSADIDHDARESRLWRVSYIDAFASNLIFVLFKCDNDDMNVLVTHQERQVQLPGCPEPPQLCPLAIIENLLSSDISCKFAQICSL